SQAVLSTHTRLPETSLWLMNSGSRTRSEQSGYAASFGTSDSRLDENSSWAGSNLSPIQEREARGALVWAVPTFVPRPIAESGLPGIVFPLGLFFARRRPVGKAWPHTQASPISGS